MKKNYFLSVGILILLIVGGYFGVQKFLINGNKAVVETLDSQKLTSNLNVIELHSDLIKKCNGCKIVGYTDSKLAYLADNELSIVDDNSSKKIKVLSEYGELIKVYFPQKGNPILLFLIDEGEYYAELHDNKNISVIEFTTDSTSNTKPYVYKGNFYLISRDKISLNWFYYDFNKKEYSKTFLNDSKNDISVSLNSIFSLEENYSRINLLSFTDTRKLPTWSSFYNNGLIYFRDQLFSIENDILKKYKIENNTLKESASKKIDFNHTGIKKIFGLNDKVYLVIPVRKEKSIEVRKTVIVEYDMALSNSKQIYETINEIHEISLQENSFSFLDKSKIIKIEN